MRCCIIRLHLLLHPASITKPIFSPNQRHSTNKTRLETTTSKPLVEVPNQAQTPTRDAFLDRSQIQLRIITSPQCLGR
ncbi:Glutathione S-transferase [Fusarium oxysporum f. sp. albedinis]|nr:Glutathione S-transferase [Fusarium oxysporum f. sp. albedinis]